MSCQRCVLTCGDREKWPRTGMCSCACHEYSREVFEPVSMMPSRAGDRAVYTEDGGTFTSAVIMWAVCRVTEETRHPNRPYNKRIERCRRRIVGMVMSDAGLECAEESGNFARYADASDTDAEIRERFGRPPQSTGGSP